MTIAEIKARNHGFVSDSDLPQIVAINRFTQLLVRCGGGRFICAAQDVKHFVDIIERDNTDYVRDVSFPAEPAR